MVIKTFNVDSMIFSLPKDNERASAYFDKLVKADADMEIKRVVKPRTANQNKYLHMLFTIFGNEFGYTVEETKITIKRELGYTYKKNGMTFLEHTSEMSVDKLARFITRFRDFSAHLGCYLPTSEEYLANYTEFLKLL